MAMMVVAAISAVAGGQIATSTFDTDNEGWMVVTTLNNTVPTIWTAAGGNPGGYAQGQDLDGGAWSFSAPGKFLGPVGAAYGHTFSFDIAHYDPEPNSTGWVGISGGSLVEHGLVHPFDSPAAPLTWYSHVITMDVTGDWWRIVDPDVPISVPATAAEILSVLQDLDALIISGEFADGIETDIAGLDNVNLAPEPATMSLLVVGSLLALRRKS